MHCRRFSTTTTSIFSRSLNSASFAIALFKTVTFAQRPQCTVLRDNRLDPFSSVYLICILRLVYTVTFKNICKWFAISLTRIVHTLCCTLAAHMKLNKDWGHIPADVTPLCPEMPWVVKSALNRSIGVCHTTALVRGITHRVWSQLWHIMEKLPVWLLIRKLLTSQLWNKMARSFPNKHILGGDELDYAFLPQSGNETVHTSCWKGR